MYLQVLLITLVVDYCQTILIDLSPDLSKKSQIGSVTEADREN